MGENNHGLLEKPEAALENIISALPDCAGQEKERSRPADERRLRLTEVGAAIQRHCEKNRKQR
jgi:hypothetical protein